MVIFQVKEKIKEKRGFIYQRRLIYFNRLNS